MRVVDLPKETEECARKREEVTQLQLKVTKLETEVAWIKANMVVKPKPL